MEFISEFEVLVEVSLLYFSAMAAVKLTGFDATHDEEINIGKL